MKKISYMAIVGIIALSLGLGVMATGCGKSDSKAKKPAAAKTDKPAAPKAPAKK